MTSLPEREWIMQDLRKLESLRARARRLDREILAMETDARALRAMPAERMPAAVRGFAEDRLAARLEGIEQRKRERGRTAAFVRGYEAMLEQLSPEERTVLELMVIDDRKGRLERARAALHYEQSHLYNLRNRALDRLAEQSLKFKVQISDIL